MARLCFSSYLCWTHWADATPHWDTFHKYFKGIRIHWMRLINEQLGDPIPSTQTPKPLRRRAHTPPPHPPSHAQNPITTNKPQSHKKINLASLKKIRSTTWSIRRVLCLEGFLRLKTMNCVKTFSSTKLLSKIITFFSYVIVNYHCLYITPAPNSWDFKNLVRRVLDMLHRLTLHVDVWTCSTQAVSSVMGARLLDWF